MNTVLLNPLPILWRVELSSTLKQEKSQPRWAHTQPHHLVIQQADVSETDPWGHSFSVANNRQQTVRKDQRYEFREDSNQIVGGREEKGDSYYGYKPLIMIESGPSSVRAIKDFLCPQIRIILAVVCWCT